MLKDAWDNISASLLQKSWSKIQNWDEDEYTEEDDIPLSALGSQTNHYTQVAAEVQTLLNQIAPDNEMTMAEIEEWNIDKAAENVESDGDESSDGEATNEVKISHSDAIDKVNGLIKWCAQNEQYGIRHSFNLMSLRSDIVTAHTKKDTKQTSLTDYFK